MCRSTGWPPNSHPVGQVSDLPSANPDRRTNEKLLVCRYLRSTIILSTFLIGGSAPASTVLKSGAFAGMKRTRVVPIPPYLHSPPRDPKTCALWTSTLRATGRKKRSGYTISQPFLVGDRIPDCLDDTTGPIVGRLKAMCIYMYVGERTRIAEASDVMPLYLRPRITKFDFLGGVRHSGR